MDLGGENTPFDFSHDQSPQMCPPNNTSKVDPALVATVYQQIMSMMKANTAGQSDCASVNFAVKITDSNANSSLVVPAHFEWIVDSGTTDHMTSERRLMHNFRDLAKPILVVVAGWNSEMSQVC
ncbi:hypothetical protein RND81_10G015200 [Saponaria officinalis]|uniref:Uncharacterized protein n=1 Tax=Saponaria officinalis TaxID=3572 RepID=A0AAW1HXB2_SAPOF